MESLEGQGALVRFHGHHIDCGNPLVLAGDCDDGDNAQDCPSGIRYLWGVHVCLPFPGDSPGGQSQGAGGRSWGTFGCVGIIEP